MLYKPNVPARAMTDAMKEQFMKRDIINELYSHDDFLKPLGGRSWVRAARTGGLFVKPGIRRAIAIVA